MLRICMPPFFEISSKKDKKIIIYIKNIVKRNLQNGKQYYDSGIYKSWKEIGEREKKGIKKLV